MADVARHLGISKATVSLAVNGKPGVNEQTRQKILQCVEEMEKNNGVVPEVEAPKSIQAVKIIKVVIINHRKQVICDPELGVWTEILSTFDAEARKRGYMYGLTYLNDTEENVQGIIDECNLDMVAGVILFGSEMEVSDHEIVKKIQKPLVLYDYEMPDEGYSSVCIDNARAVELALNVLTEDGISDIRYLSTGKNIYNFAKRREAFWDVLSKREKFPKKSDMVSLGNSTEEITEKAIEYLSTHKLPDAFVLENYQVSIGVMAAARKLGISVPENLKLVGIDEVPGYIVSNVKLPQIRIPHEDRAAMAIAVLDREINKSWNTKIRVFAMPELVNGGK